MAVLVAGDGTPCCRRCSLPVGGYWPRLGSVRALQRCAPAQRVALLVDREGVAEDVARRWVHHIFEARCARRVAFCNACDGELRSWMATSCPHCKRGDVRGYFPWPDAAGEQAT